MDQSQTTRILKPEELLKSDGATHRWFAWIIMRFLDQVEFPFYISTLVQEKARIRSTFRFGNSHE